MKKLTTQTSIVPLREARKQRNMSQFLLSVLSGVNQSRISQCENGKLILNTNEQRKILKTLNNVDFDRCDFAMPKETINQSPEQGIGIKVRVSADPDDLPNPTVVHINEREVEGYRYMTWEEFLQQK